MISRSDILDETLDRLELKVRTHDALRTRFGKDTMVRELVMMSALDLQELLKPYHGHPSILVTDIEDGLQRAGYTLGTSWSDLPPSKYAIVRNPARMKAHKPG